MSPPCWRAPGSRLRELRASDAVPLLAAISTTDVARFISPPPDTAAGFERFIADARRQRALGEAICFGVLTAGYPRRSACPRAPDRAAVRSRRVGLCARRRVLGRGAVPRRGAAGDGLGVRDAGRARLECALGHHQRPRERRAATAGRRAGSRAAQVTARDGEYLDQVLWTLTAEGWLAMHPGGTARCTESQFASGTIARCASPTSISTCLPSSSPSTLHPSAPPRG